MGNDEDIKKIREMLEFLVKQKISDAVRKIDKEDTQVYNLTGTKGQTEIAKITGISAGKISSLWQKWENEGLLIKDGKSYRKVV